MSKTCRVVNTSMIGNSVWALTLRGPKGLVDVHKVTTGWWRVMRTGPFNAHGGRDHKMIRNKVASRREAEALARRLLGCGK